MPTPEEIEAWARDWGVTPAAVLEMLEDADTYDELVAWYGHEDVELRHGD